MAAGQQGRAEARQLPPAEPARRSRASDGAVRRAAPDGPAFINDRAEEQHHHDVLRDPSSSKAAQAAARIEIARLREAQGQFADAAEMYEQNVWAGDRSPATYVGLASAYRELGRDDLADAALEQIRREGGAGRPDGVTSDVQPARTASRSRSRFSPESTSRTDRPRASRRRGPAESGARATTAQAAREQPESASSIPLLGEVQRAIAPFLAGQAGNRTLVVSTVLLPIVVGLGIFAAVVLTSTRARTAEPAPQPTPAPVATVAPTAAPTAAPTVAIPPALSEPPAPARLVVNNVGSDGLSLRRTAGTTGQRIKVWNDGTEMADLGETTENGGQAWRKVRDPDGNVGWVAAEYLAEPGARAGSAPAPAPTFPSGGLGLSRTEWETAHGQPSRSSIFLEYDSGRLVVGLLEGNVMHIERVWMRGDAVSLDAARDDARAYLPRDAVQGQSIDRGDGRIIDVYSSASLAGRFAPTAWNGGQVGTFSIQYRFRTPADRMVTSAMFRLGDALP